MNNYFNNSCSFPLSEILNLRSYCFKVNLELSSLSQITISSREEETIIYKKLFIRIDELRLVFRTLIQDFNILLKEKLLLGLGSSRYKDITLEEFSKFEDLSNRTPFQCFKDFNPQSQSYNLLLQDLVFKDKNLKYQFFNKEDSTLVLSKTRVNSYLASIKEFLKLGFLIIYLTSGLPLRGPELSTLRFQNSYKDQREIFLDRGSNLFLINISYRKGSSYLEKEGSNIRFLSREISLVFLKYIVLVIPFIEFLNISTLSSKVYKKIYYLNPYFFNIQGNILDSRILSSRLSSYTNQVIGKKVNLQSWRQIIVLIIEEFMFERLDKETLILEVSKDYSDKFQDIRASQMNHSIKTEELNYGRSSTTLVNSRRSLQLRYYEFCLRFFRFFKIDQVDLDSSIFISLLDTKSKIEIDQRQRGLTSLALRYSTIQQNSTLGSSSLKHSRNKSSIDNRIIKKVKVQDLLDISSSSSLFQDILETLLREFLNNPQAKFKILEQQLLIQAILAKIPYILGVLPTNSGKSLSYLLTSSLTISKISIVIVPLVGLKQDLFNRSQKLGIPTSIFEENQEFKTLTLVSIETIIQEDFLFQVQKLIELQELDRIILDECHLLLTASNYRSIMFRFKEILKLPCQFLFLTGTLPLKLEDSLKSFLKLENLITIRARTTRNTISYQTKEYFSLLGSKQILEVQEYIEKFQNSLQGLYEKILIFCPTINSILTLNKVIPSLVYYSNLENKDKVLEQFQASQVIESQILISSSSLEEGFDYPNIKLVVYIDFCYSFLGFLQGSSRGGRDNQESISFFFYKKQEVIDQELDSQDKAIFRRYLRESVCKRRVIDQYLDSILTDSCLNSQAKCSCCLQRLAIQKQTISGLESFNQEVEVQRNKFRDLIKLLNYSCIYCFLLENKEERHSSSYCSKYSILELELMKVLQNIRDQTKIQDSCCFTCYLPTLICSSLKEVGSNKCFNRKIVPRIFITFKLKESILKLDRFIRFKKPLKDLEVLKIFFSKVFLEDLDTESILGIKVLREFLEIRK